MLNFILSEEKDTIDFGRKLAHVAKKGDVFALYGTLGVGKSVLARAFIAELSGASEIPSPTFTLVQGYSSPDFEIYHYDLYRLKSPEEIFEIGMQESMYEAVSLIEWPEKMERYLPQNAFMIKIENNNEGRKLSIESADASNYERLKTL